MSVNESQINQAVCEALVYSRQLDRSQPGVEPAYVGQFAEFADLYDDDIVVGAYHPDAGFTPDRVLTDSPEGLYVAVQAIARQTKITIPKKRIVSEIVHEMEHADAMQALGFTAIQYGVYVDYESDVAVPKSWTPRRLSWVPFAHAVSDRPVTKLEFAAVIAAPNQLSHGDSHRLSLMGYDGVPEVGARIVDHNAKRPNKLQLPAGYRRRTIA